MSNFQGYLLKFGDVEFPNKYLEYDNQQSTPNQRTEAEAYVDANNHLHRVTLPKYRSKIEYNTVDGLTLADKVAIQNILRQGLVDSVQRKYLVTYWNEEDNEYKTSYFYIPDTTFQIERLNEKTNDIIYKSLKLTLIEY